LTKRKDSFAELKKTKKVDNEYGIGASSKNLETNRFEPKATKDITNIKGTKKSRNLM
jgi:hypothetical protein